MIAPDEPVAPTIRAHHIVAFDPGGVHVGVSAWRHARSMGGWYADWSVEWAWEEAIERVMDWLFVGPELTPGFVAYETFRLRGGTTALAQTGKTFPEVELIGVIRAVTNRVGIRLVGVEPSNRAAAVKRAQALGYKWAAHGSGGHARDAEAVAICALDLRAGDLMRLGTGTRPVVPGARPAVEP